MSFGLAVLAVFTIGILAFEVFAALADWLHGHAPLRDEDLELSDRERVGL